MKLVNYVSVAVVPLRFSFLRELQTERPMESYERKYKWEAGEERESPTNQTRSYELITALLQPAVIVTQIKLVAQWWESSYNECIVLKFMTQAWVGQLHVTT